MTVIINDPGCTSSAVGNTGVDICPKLLDKPVMLILIPKGSVIANASLTSAGMITAIQAGTVAARSVRMYPITGLDNLKDNSEDITKVTSGYGRVSITKEGKYIWTLDIPDAGFYSWQQLRKFNKSKAFDCLLVDDNDLVVGTLVGSDMGGFSIDTIFFKPQKINDGANSTAYTFEISLSDPGQLNDYPCYVQLESKAEDVLKGIIDVEIYEAAAPTGTTTGILTVGLRTMGGKVTLYDAFDTEFEVEAMWVITKASDGTSVTLTSAVKNTAGYWVLTLASTTGGTTYNVNLTTAALLRAGSIGVAPASGYEAYAALAQTLPGA